LYTVDDLQDIIQEGLRSRQEAAKQAEKGGSTTVAIPGVGDKAKEAAKLAVRIMKDL
jgi:glutamyl-tRNA reductase